MKPYKPGDLNWSDPTIRFTNAKKHIEAGTGVFLDEDLKEVVNYMEKIRQGIIDDPERIKDFIINDLGILTQIILSKNFRIMIELQMQGKLQPFVFKVLYFCLEFLPQNYPGLFEIIQLLLNNNHSYYSHNPYYQAHDVVDELYRKFPPTFNICPVSKSVHASGTHIVSQIAQMEFDDGLKRMNPQCIDYKIVKDVKYPDENFIKSSCMYQKISIVYLINLNYFIQIGGHEKIFEYMKSFHTMNNLLPSLNFFYNLANFMDEDFYQEKIVPYLTEVLKELPKTLDKEEIKHAKKDDINNLFQILQNVLKNSKNKATTSKNLTIYELDILLVYLKSQYMEKRIFAITNLVERISEAESHQEEYDSLQKHLAKRNEEEGGDGNHGNNEKDFASIHWFRKENYLNWLKENQIVNVLLGESSHAEVLRRSSPLFRFLFRNGELSLENVEAICDLAIEKHDTFRKHILTILGDLAELMNTDQLQHLFEKIKGLSAQEWDQDVLQLIKTIGNNSIPKREEEASSPKNRYKDNKDDENSYKITINEESREDYYNQGTREDMEAFIGSETIKKKEDKEKEKVYVELSPEAREKGEKLAREIVEFLWRIIIEGKSGKNSNQQLVSSATSIVKEMMSEKLEKERLIFVEKAVLAISQNVALTESFDILQYVLKGKFPIQKQDGTLLHSKRDLIVFIENEYSISNTLFSSMILLKSDLVACLGEKGGAQIPEEETKAQQTEDPPSSAKIRLTALGEAEEEIYKVYLKEVEERLKFIRMLKNNSYEKLELEHAKLMWKLLVENAIDEPERDLFFGTFNSIIYYANDESRILSEEIINYIFFEVLLEVDFSSYTLPIFFCFEEFFKHLNKHCNVIKLDYHDFKVRSLDLIGFDFLWELYLNCPDQKIVSKAQGFILKLSTHLIDKSSRVSFIETAVQHIRKSYEDLKENLSLAQPDNDLLQRISRSLDFISGFLQEYGELHIHRGKQNPADAIQVIISNQMPGAQAPKKFNITLYKTMTFSEAKSLIASRLTPPVAPREITLISRGSILDNEGAILDELKIQNEQTIMCTKNTSADDTEMQPIALMNGPEPMPQNEDAADVWQKIEGIQAFMPHLETDFVKWVLKRKNYDADDAATSLLDPGLEDFYRREFEKEEKEEKQPKVQEITTSKQEGSGDAFKALQPSMSQSLSNNIETLNLFFELLGLESAEIEAKVWNLLVNLPLNKEIYESIKNVFGENEYEDFETIIDWPSVLDPQSTSKLLYSLQIVHTFISCEAGDESGNNEDSLNKSAWRINFLRNEGFGYLMNFLTKIPESSFLKATKNLGHSEAIHNTEAKTLQLILSILKIYIHSALTATTPGHLQKILRSTLDFNKPEVPEKIKKNQKKRQGTPTFGPQAEEEGRDNNDDNPYAGVSSSGTREDKGKEQVQEFEDLVGVMRQYDDYLVGKALEYESLKNLVVKILGIIKSSLEFIDKDGDLASLVESAFSFMLPCFVTYPQLLEVLYGYEGTEGILRSIFFESQQENVKSKLTQMISFLSLHFKELIMKNDEDQGWKLDEDDGDSEAKEEKEQIGSPENYFLKKLLPLVYSCNTNDRVTLEYFQMLSNLIHNSDRETVNKITDLSRLYAFSIRFIIDRPILEDRSSEYQDKILAGFLLLAQNLVEIEPTLREIFQQNNALLQEFSLENVDLLKELYDFLFYLPTENEKSGASLGPPKCKHVQTRQHVFKLLRELCHNNQENLKRTLDLLSNNHKKLPYFSFDDTRASSSTTMLNSELKNTTGYVGLKNLGCTCYMNSLIQQFFMILPLRNTILNSEVKIKLRQDEENEEVERLLSQLGTGVYEENKKEIQPQLNDNTLYQLQVLLAHLAESASEYVYPTQFFNSIKTINGEKIVLNVQQDVNEFFNTLCDKLDICMKGTPQQTALPDLIGGMLSHEIISLEKDYPYYAEREEAYLTLPLDIKNKRDINEAMNLFVKEDILEGDNKYFCEKYNRKIKVMKRCCIKTLPNTLIITLKRFDFDFNLMQKVKINDFFEFPLSFNIKPWTIVGLKDQIPPEANFELPEYPESYYKYELVGVLVHSGTAEGGHYYSFIKDRSGQSRGWFEFNDNKVTPFDVKNLKTECFGAEGSASQSVYDDFDLTNIKSAYILFYERTVEESSETLVKYKDQGVNKTLSSIIWSENIELLRTKYFYNVDYFNFMLDLVKFYEFSEVLTVPSSYSEEENEEGDQEEELYGNDIKILKMAIILASEIYLKNKDADGFAKWIKLIENVLDKFIPGAIWLMKLIIKHPDFLNLIYLEEVSGIVKEAVRDLLSKVINIVYGVESSYFNEEQTITGAENQREIKKVRRSSLARFLLNLKQEYWLDKDTNLSKPIKKLGLLTTLIKLNQHIAHYLVEAGFLKAYWDLFISIQRVMTATSISNLAKDKDLYNSTNILGIFQAIEALLRSCITDSMKQYESLGPTYLFGDKVNWSTCPRVPASIVKDIQESEVLKKLMLPMQDKCDNLLQITQHLSWQNKEASKRIILLLIGFACSFVSDPKDVDESLKIVYNLVKLEDHYLADRVECVFSKEGPKTGSCARDEDLISSMKKAKDHYAKGHAILGLRWITSMAAEVLQVKYYIQQNGQKLEWAIEFLHEQMNLKYPVYASVDDNMKVKMPNYVKKAHDILLDILPLFKAPEPEKIEEIPEDLPVRNEVTGPDNGLRTHKNKEENLFSIVDYPDDE